MADSERVKLSLIILNWNTRELLKQCLESLGQRRKDANLPARLAGAVAKRAGKAGMQRCGEEIIVVDNGSRDGSQEYLKTQMSKLKTKTQNLKLKIILNRENLGFAKGNNVGIKEAKGDYILLLNSDTLIVDGALSRLVDFMDSHPEIAVAGPRLLNKDGSFQASVGRFPTLPVVFWMLFREHFGGSTYVRRSPTEGGEVDWVMGAALMARKEVFEKTGLLDEKMFMYMEEVEWCYRAKKAGFKIYFYPDVQITHLWQGSSQTGRKDPILNIYRGLTYFYRKHRSPLEFIILRLLLKFKAMGAITVGYLKNSQYLKETYREAYKLA